ncbi:MAG: oligosaccharide flippase family protein [Oceanospirillaceae bacterium]|nr:oligosaccharide flippase family protein [Oceanospirillaceae bacterium]
MEVKNKSLSQFNRHVLTLMTGTTIAQAIPIAISPVLTRIYSPEDFGLLALFVAITATLSSVINGKYELAIMIPEKDDDAIHVAALGVLIALFLSFLLLFFVVFFSAYFVRVLANDDIAPWLYLVPLVVLLNGIYNTLIYLNNRKMLYGSLAKSNIYRSVANAGLQLLFGFFKFGGAGLILGQFISLMLGVLSLIKNVIVGYAYKGVVRTQLWVVAKKYSSFPKYTVFATLANTLSQNIISMLIPILYDIKTLGFYSLVQRVLGVPSSLVGEAVGQVFHREVAEERRETGRGVISFNSTIKKLLVVGIPGFLFLYFIVIDLFVFVFGEKWQLAGEYAQLLIPLFFMRFIVSSVSVMNTVFLKNKNGLYFQFSLLIMSLLVLYISNFIGLTDKEFLSLLNFILSVVYMIFGIYLNRLKYG